MDLESILVKYSPRDLTRYNLELTNLKQKLVTWGSSCYITTLDSGSRAKGTAISLASDVDYLVSLKSDCNENSGGLESIYSSLYEFLDKDYTVRKQNVSIRITINGLEVDVTPARRQPASVDKHWLYVSKTKTRTQTNIQKHIYDIKSSGLTNEIKIIKIWRELNKLEFPSIYFEYLIINIIFDNIMKRVGTLDTRVWFILKELARDSGNPLYRRLVDPANSTNILSDLMTDREKDEIISQAKIAISKTYWSQIVW